MGRFTNGAIVLSVLGVAMIVELSNQGLRGPASTDSFELKIHEVGLDTISRVAKLDQVFVRAHFAQDKVFDIGRNSPFTIDRGQKQTLGYKLDLDPSWIRDDSVEFKLELVEAKGFEHVVVRCAQIARSLSSYNRMYQCHIPGEQTPVLSYRVGRKGSDQIPQVAAKQ